MSRHLFTSESVTEGHPDKIADAISDAVLDSCLADDSLSRVACETLVTTGMAIVAGEVTTETYVDIPKVVRSTLLNIGYDEGSKGIDGATCAVLVTLDRQSPHIAMGVDTGGAGDQGMMFGYATDETDVLMPAPIHFAHALTQRLAEVRKSGLLEWVRPDGKSQVTLVYEDGKPVAVETVVISTQHGPEVGSDEIRAAIIEHVIVPTLPEHMLDPDTCVFHINPTGKFEIGGPHGDTGLTGRKIIVDTYGGMGRHGGGAFSGKDATKVDRSAAYAARWAAKNLVWAGAATRCEIQLAYAIGVASPVSIRVECFGSNVVSEEKMEDVLADVFDFTPRSIIDHFKLQDPIFSPASAYGHFGREPKTVTRGDGRTVELFTWEKLDLAEELKSRLGL